MMPKPVVVGTDGSRESLHAVEWAAAEAARRSVPLRIVSVMAVPAHVSSAGDSPVTLDDLMSSIYSQSLQTTAQRAATVAPGLAITTELLTGSPRQVLADEAEAAAVLVVGAYGIGGYAQPGAGPETRYVTLRASCPIAVIRDPGGIEHREIAVGVRDADHAEAALRFAFEEAALRKARLTVVHACDEHNPPVAHLAESLGNWRRLFPHVAVSHNEIDGYPGRTLTSYSGFMDLIVVGRHDGPNRNAAHGSVTQMLLNHAHGPVIIVPAGNLGDANRTGSGARR
jgi:nucleotide-binding universal stress UspA family protein